MELILLILSNNLIILTSPDGGRILWEDHSTIPQTIQDHRPYIDYGRTPSSVIFPPLFSPPPSTLSSASKDLAVGRRIKNNRILFSQSKKGKVCNLCYRLCERIWPISLYCFLKSRTPTTFRWLSGFSEAVFVCRLPCYPFWDSYELTVCTLGVSSESWLLPLESGRIFFNLSPAHLIEPILLLVMQTPAVCACVCVCHR